MDILKIFLNNPAFDHLAENIIRFMDTDEAMETMIESEFLSDEERKVMRKILRRLMVKEAQMFCDKKVMVTSEDPDQDYEKVTVKTTLYEMFPFFKDALQQLKKSESLESFNQLYDILVWLQPGESQLDDEAQLQELYEWSDFYLKRKYLGNFSKIFQNHKGPTDMLDVFQRANDFEPKEKSEDEDEDDYDGNDSEDWNSFSDSDEDEDEGDYDGNYFEYWNYFIMGQ